MMYLLDTNIILLNLQRNSLAYRIREELDLTSETNTAYISIVTVAEILSLAMQNKWGAARMASLHVYLSSFVWLDVTVESVLNRYAEIDAFSQNRLANRPLGMSARNMGKNDLWIAATASVLGATLVTTDNDFTHLHTQFLTLKRYSMQ